MRDMADVSEGDRVRFQPKNGGTFPTGEKTRSGEVEALRGETIIIRQPDGFTTRISEEQVV